MDKKTVGLRELGQNVSRVFEGVKRGDTLVVTEHGREIAKIVPLRESSVLDQLMEEGEATRPTLGLEEFFSLPIPHADNGRASLVLEELRNDER